MSDQEAEYSRLIQLQAHHLLTALTETQTRPMDPESSLDTNMSIEALLTVAAAILETSSPHASKRELRVSTDAAADRLKLYVRQMRAHFEETGRHGLELIGGTPSDPLAPPPRKPH